jgi:uncharacterized protein YerC
MQVSKKKVNANLEKQLFSMLYQLVADIKTSDEAEIILKGLFSEIELTAFAKRVAIGYWLHKGRSYENIKQNLKVSSATVAEVQQNIKSKGWKGALQKLTADEWANQWEAKIKSFFKR